MHGDPSLQKVVAPSVFRVSDIIVEKDRAVVLASSKLGVPETVSPR